MGFQGDVAFMKKIHLLLALTELIQSTFTEHRQWPCTLCEVLRRTKKNALGTDPDLKQITV